MQVKREILTDWVKDIFCGMGMGENQAATISNHLVLANLRGVDSHGVSKVDIYSKRLEKKIVNMDLTYSIEKETPVSALIDGQNSMGIPLATKGMELATRKAVKSGVGIVGVKHSNHGGMLAAYTSYAAANDCIALATTNAAPSMAPWGGKEKFFGTNPISYGIPTGEEMNIVFDMATTIVAKGKIVLAEMENRKIPLGWAITKDGKDTTDPKEALEGMILPSGGPKGYGITFFVEVLSSLFTGATYGPHISNLFHDFENKQDVGQFFFVMRADLFEDLHVFKNRMDKLVEEIRNVDKMENVSRIYLPGEIEWELSKKRELEGIPVSDEVIGQLKDISIKYQVNIPEGLEITN
ncbi:Ldh family oxidoreductase [Oceanobacillus bengalensis]|uniref:Ldh family oxidoreductase n=1 Tax=Oceanobacillus bengalensis TaxID=1435466 RepID=A0A494YX71_9BACI|nr:Ldh family oxidoreductase [Oceanobacillus bengalensis]RKQ14762.1 Ldh family oxidoreductase [Oceanobacillus bengalensis]